MRRDYRLYELNDEEFEALVIRICTRWLGQGVTPFAPGKDGGRDGKFHGKATCFPSPIEPLNGHFVLQAKHVQSPNKSCSDKDFEALLKKEHKKVQRLIEKGICDHYLVFTNRKYTGGADEKLIEQLKSLGLKSAHIIGLEKLSLALEEYQDIAGSLPNWYDRTPFYFEPDDIVEVIEALHEYAEDDQQSAFQSAKDFEKLKLHEKNKINGVSAEYYQQIIVNDSMPHFLKIDNFLSNPRNLSFADLYHDAADEIKRQILLKRSDFGSFDHVFNFLYREIQQKRENLKGRRRLVSILLHYMYCNCDIGSKNIEAEKEVLAHADA